MLTRREFTAAAGLAIRAERRPNVVVVMPDQLRAQALGVMGNEDARTPHIDQLAKQGVLFRSTLANSPVCCPARAILVTGAYCHRNGMTANDLRLRESSRTITKELRTAGYQTGFTGKWHLDGGPRLPGFIPPGERRQGFEWWAANECSHTHFNTQYFRDTPEPRPVKRFEPEAWTDLALEFIDSSRKKDAPFFLSVWMGPPHDPYKAPDNYSRMFDPAKLKMRPNWKGGPGLAGPKEIAEYYAMTMAVDDQVGRLVRALDEWGLGEDTILLFASDHGDMLGSQGMPLKRKPWEESLRVPGILRWPRKVKPGRVEEALFSHIDVVPTILGLCGVPKWDGLQGQDFSALILGDERKGPESAFFQIFGPYQAGRVPAGWRGVRSSRWMYARFREKPWVLYDLEKDPNELENLADAPAARKVREEMEKRLKAWMKTTGDSWDFNWTYPVEDGGRLYKDRTWYTVTDYLTAAGVG